jgi:RNA polymerase sigma factor (sigma-70 family)
VTTGPTDLTSVLAQRDELIRFVRKRVENDAAAEEIVQSAFLKGIEADIRDEESAVAWMYRTLRNAVVDHYRRRDAAGRIRERAEAEADETDPTPAPDERARTCQCVRSLARALKPEYASILEQVAVEERLLAEVARDQGITSNNATVRLHRARKALREAVVSTCGSCATHGCVDCTCKHSS